MSFSTAKTITLGEKKGVFSGWYADNTPNLYLAENLSPYLRNARLDGASIIIRPGHSLFATLTAGSYPKGIGAYIRASSTDDRIVVRHNTDATHKLYTITSTWTTTSIVTGANITSDNRMHFQNGNDVIFCMNGVDIIGKLSGTTYTTLSAIPASFAPSFSTVFNWAHWASGWSSNPNRVYISVGSTFDDFTGTGSDSIDLSEPCTSLAGNNETLFYFTKNTVSATSVSDIIDTSGTLTYITRPLQVKEGAINNASTVAVGNFVFYVTPSNKIVRIRRGQNIDWFETEELSDRPYRGITKLMATLDTDQSDSFGYFLPKQNLIKWFFKTEWATFNDICVVYDITKDAFLIDSQKYFFWGVFFGGKNYTISMIEPKVYQDEYAQDDEDSPIQFEYWTKEFYISDPTYKKILWETRTLLDVNELAQPTQEIWIDWGLKDSKTINDTSGSMWQNLTIMWSEATQTWQSYASSFFTGWIGTETIGEDAIWEEWEDQEEYQETYILRTKWNLNVKGKKIQFRYTNSSLAGKVRLKNISARVEVLSDLATDLTP